MCARARGGPDAWLLPWLAGLVFGIGFGLSAGLADAQESGTPPPEVPASLLDLVEAEDLEGRRWDRGALAGQVVLVDFWATWCAPCLAQMPALEEAYGRYRPRGFELLAISLDEGSTRRLRSWLRPRDLPWPQIHRPLGTGDPLARSFGVEAVPRSFLFDRSGRLLAVDLEPRALVATLDALLPSVLP